MCRWRQLLPFLCFGGRIFLQRLPASHLLIVRVTTEAPARMSSFLRSSQEKKPLRHAPKKHLQKIRGLFTWQPPAVQKNNSAIAMMAKARTFCGSSMAHVSFPKQQSVLYLRQHRNSSLIFVQTMVMIMFASINIQADI